MTVKSFRILVACLALGAFVGGMLLLSPWLFERSDHDILGQMGRHYRVVVEGEKRFYSALDDDSAQAFLSQVVDFQNAFFATYGQAFGLARPDRTIRILEFRSPAEYQAYCDATIGKEKLQHTGGFHDPLRSLIAYHASEAVSRRETVFHELTHYNFDAGIEIADPSFNYWFAEGVASYLERGRVEGGKLFVRGVSANAYLARHRNPFTEIARLYSASRDRDVLGADNSRFYGAAELLVSFLMSRFPDGFFRYARRECGLGRPNELDLAFDCEVELEELQRLFNAYLEQISHDG